MLLSELETSVLLEVNAQRVKRARVLNPLCKSTGERRAVRRYANVTVRNEECVTATNLQ